MSVKKTDLYYLPEQFVVFDLETTGLKPDIHEIIEIGAIRVNADSRSHDTFQSLVIPDQDIPWNITRITGITRDMIEFEGRSPESVLPQFLEFVGDLPLVAFNAGFDMAFLRKAANRYYRGSFTPKRVSCALKMARRAWPGRKSYRLTDLSRDNGLTLEDTHRAVGDCKRTMHIYTAAASVLKSDR